MDRPEMDRRRKRHSATRFDKWLSILTGQSLPARLRQPHQIQKVLPVAVGNADINSVQLRQETGVIASDAGIAAMRQGGPDRGQMLVAGGFHQFIDLTSPTN